MSSVYLLENEVIEIFCQWLKNNGWQIQSKALNRERGYDIHASSGKKVMFVEAKGARGNPQNHSVCREKFDTGQIKDHLGKAIVKVLETKSKEPDAILVIAHPMTDKIAEVVKPIAKQLHALGIQFVFVRADGTVIWSETASLAITAA